MTARISFTTAITASVIATNQLDQFRDWLAAMAALRNLTTGHDGAEQVAAVCRRVAASDFHATPAQWRRLQAAYWASTDGHGRLIPSRLAAIQSV